MKRKKKANKKNKKIRAMHKRQKAKKIAARLKSTGRDPKKAG